MVREFTMFCHGGLVRLWALVLFPVIFLFRVAGCAEAVSSRICLYVEALVCWVFCMLRLCSLGENTISRCWLCSLLS